MKSFRFKHPSKRITNKQSNMIAFAGTQHHTVVRWRIHLLRIRKRQLSKEAGGGLVRDFRIRDYLYKVDWIHLYIMLLLLPDFNRDELVLDMKESKYAFALF